MTRRWAVLRPGARRLSVPPGWPALAFLAVATAGLGAVASTGALVGLSVGLSGTLLAALLTARRGERARDLSGLPLLVALGLLVAWAPVALATELLAGAAGVALLLWLSGG
ncbi:MAG: hypothetical protein ACRECR_06480, partial [Thermoplasmata archaeon]